MSLSRSLCPSLSGTAACLPALLRAARGHESRCLLLADLDPTRPLVTDRREEKSWIQRWMERTKMYFVKFCHP